MFNLIEVSQKAKKPSKKGKFAISINEQGRSKYYVKKLSYLIKEKYPFLNEKCGFNRAKALRNAKGGDLIVFGVSRKHDFSVMTMDSFVEDPRISHKMDAIDLEAGFKLVKEALKRYVEKNYPWKVPAKIKKQVCYAPKVSPCVAFPGIRPVVSCPLVVTTPPCRPVRVASAPRSCPRDWDMQVNNTYVLLTNGSRYETRKIQKCGNRETVRIDNRLYTIRRDSYGRGIVV